ncbi:putative calcium-binding protein CML19 [Malania oleifera]|uniref:putative calcium-binding protein CML19 n=1 Tax=Malania oleifera TaxID=397392 RepID=UPI0025AE4579|nr:putative calcium-binding protein CML19 [Malania oleifera]
MDSKGQLRERVFRHLDCDGDGNGNWFLEAADLVRLAEGSGEEERRRGLREAFRMFETTSSTLSPEEEDAGGRGRGSECITAHSHSLRRMLGKLGERRTVGECLAMIARIDLDGDGVISFDEFVVMMS